MRAMFLLWLSMLAASASAQTTSRPPDGLVIFINSSSAPVTVSVDGSYVCTIAPGNRCSTVLGGDLQSEHSVSAESNGRSWSDRIKAWECHANWNGTKTYTFRDDSVPFDCVK